MSSGLHLLIAPNWCGMAPRRNAPARDSVRAVEQKGAAGEARGGPVHRTMTCCDSMEGAMRLTSSAFSTGIWQGGDGRPNRRIQLTSVEHLERLQPIPGVRRTIGSEPVSERGG
jgi:hypothetical protein